MYKLFFIPIHSTSIPPKLKPVIPAITHVMEIAEFATSSSSLETRLGITESLAGRKKHAAAKIKNILTQIGAMLSL